MARIKNGHAKRKHIFQVIIEQDEAGYFVAECPALRGCYTQGRTYEEALLHIRDVIELCLKELKSKGRGVPTQPEIIAIKRLEVSA